MKMSAEVITKEAYTEQYEKNQYFGYPENSITCARYCKADLLADYVLGAFVIPDKERLLGKKTWVGYFLIKDKITFIDDGDFAKEMIEQLVFGWKEKEINGPYVLAACMEYLIREDGIFLQKYEEKLSAFEEQLLEGEIGEFDRKILSIRRELLILDSYYQQLRDIGELLAENSNHLFEEEECRLFDIFSGRAARLHEQTHTLKEYSMQIREMYQSQIELRQNKIMKFLTIVTTIFMPLTLITGWYGMNFLQMPERKSPYGYPAVMVISVMIVLLEIWYFKRKGWLD